MSFAMSSTTVQNGLPFRCAGYPNFWMRSLQKVRDIEQRACIDPNAVCRNQIVLVLPMNTRGKSFYGRDALRAVRLIIWPHNTEKKWDGTEAVPPRTSV